MIEIVYDPHTRQWQARIDRNGRLYVGVGITQDEAIRNAEHKAHADH